MIIDLGETLPEFIVSITDVSGKLLKQSTYKNTQKLELNLDVQPGFYLLTIDSENKRQSEVDKELRFANTLYKQWRKDRIQITIYSTFIYN